MGTLNFECKGCGRGCKIVTQGTPDERLEKYFVCPDITMHDKQYQDPIMEKDPSEWNKNEEGLYLVKCICPGLTCCDHRCVATGLPDNNVQNCQIWCRTWREVQGENRIRRFCQRGY